MNNEGYTIDSLAQYLGLSTPEEYWQHSIEWNDKHPYRSGKTTAMLLAAAVHAQTGSVLVLGCNLSTTEYLQLQLLKLCKEAKIPVDNIIFGFYDSTRNLNKIPNTKVFIDHSRYELETLVNLGYKTVTLQELLAQQYLRIKP